ncbi:MAG: lipid A biosynthesis acyltransferase, partial [Burkholderiaceae bacterium]|nr:lipid A biosynthesis acyltransferase [Burkholderiaceae bacterium]
RLLNSLNPDCSGYICHIGKALESFPSDDEEADTARLNQCFENAIRLRPAEYYWVHKRFKNRPTGEVRIY